MMIFTKRKPLPLFFILLSILYFIYVVSSGSSRMIGDERNGDPGGMLLPLILSVLMFAASMYLFLTDTWNESLRPEQLGKAERQLFVLTLACAIGYVLLSRSLGFILCTVLLLYTLCFYNLRAQVSMKDFSTWILGLIPTVVVLLAVYTVNRFVTRTLLSAGRRGEIPAWLGSSGFSVFLSLLITVSCLFLAFFLLRKRFSMEQGGEKKHAAWLSGMIAAGATELLYLIFKQMFLVELAKGLVVW